MKRPLHTSSACLVAVLLAAASGCTNQFEKTINEGSGLGYPEKICEVDENAGSIRIPVIATMEYQIHTDASWLDVPSCSPAGREGFEMRYEANGGLPRTAEVIVSIEQTHHHDTLSVRQKGRLVPHLETENNVLCIDGSSSGTVRADVSTNIDKSLIEISFSCDGESDWIEDVEFDGTRLSFSYDANPDSFVRRAVVSLVYHGAFGDSIALDFLVTQKSSTDSAGREMSLDEFCALADVAGTVIEEDIIIEGIVVSDKAGGNCGEDLSTVYLESPDAERGLMLRTATVEDNLFLQGDRVKLSLRGARLYRSSVLDASKDPVYYYCTGLKGNMAIEKISLGREGLPLKTRTINGLRDEDIFTYVTIPDCEIPVRKGPLTPISERFTSVFGSDKVSKFGILLHDIYGGSMYLYTNVSCPYRRNGERLPYGSGNMSGVVVHELYPSFSWQDNASGNVDSYGNIGRYQLRHTCREDFDLAATMEERSFSGIICEWRYVLDKNLEKYYATDGDKTAYFTYSFVYPDSYTDGRAGKLPINKVEDWSYLGPVGESNAGNINGAGVVLDDGQDWMSPDWSGYNSEYAADANAKGYGNITANAGSAWGTNLTARNGEPMWTTLVFSTAGLSSQRMSLQLSSMNNFHTSTQNVNGLPVFLAGPRYWRVEYSLDNSSWTAAASYSLPDFCQTTPVAQPWQTPGFKQVNIPLPASKLMGQEKVYIRIIPEASLLSGSKTDYIDPSIHYPNSGSFPTAWNYIGIRYNTVDVPATDFGGSDIDSMNPIDYNW